MSALRQFDLRRLRLQHWLAGVDEAGRGALAGPVVAGAVILGRDFYHSAWCRRHGGRIRDSKQLPPEERTDLFAALQDQAAGQHLRWAAGVASVDEIESLNILGATRLAMARALEAAAGPDLPLPRPEEPLFAPAPVTGLRILIDGKPLRPFPFPHEAFVGGDDRSLAIALASIVAKVTRDRLMQELGGPDCRYGFPRHKGYATPEHRSAIRAHGPCVHHRSLFLRKLLACPDLPDEAGEALFDDLAS